MAKKILGNIEDEIHKKINLIKIENGFKSISKTLEYLIEIYTKYKLKGEENERGDLQ